MYTKIADRRYSWFNQSKKVEVNKVAFFSQCLRRNKEQLQEDSGFQVKDRYKSDQTSLYKLCYSSFKFPTFAYSSSISNNLCFRRRVMSKVKSRILLVFQAI